MQGNNSMNTSSQPCRERAQKAYEARKNDRFFEPKMFGLPMYLRNAAPSIPIKHGSNGPACEMRKERQKKTEGKRERKKEKMQDQIKKKKKKKKKKHRHAQTFSHCDHCAMTFRECKNLAVLDCEE